MKRVLSLMLAFAVVFSVVSVPKTKAIAPALAAAPAALSLLGDIAITCGVVFTAHETVEPVLDQIFGTMSLEQQGMLDTASRNGKYIVDAIDGAYKYVVSIPDQLWSAIKNGVDTLYNPGQVAVYDGSITHFPTGAQVYDSGYLPLAVGQSIKIVETTGTVWEYKKINQITIAEYKNGVYNKDLIFGNQAYTSVKVRTWKYSYTYKTSVSFATETTQDLGYYVQYYDKIVSMSMGTATHLGNITAQSGVVDNPAWDYENYHSKKRDIPLPLRQGLLPDVLTDAPPISWDEAKEKMLGKTVEDIAAERVDGVPITVSLTGTITGTEAVTDAPAIPEAGSESNTSLRALMFSKFPFCLPWDIKNTFALMLAPAKPPEWEIDLVPANLKQYMKSDTKWEINMDGFEVVGQISRWTATIGFCLALIVLTRRIIRS